MVIDVTFMDEDAVMIAQASKTHNDSEQMAITLSSIEPILPGAIW